jgi:hypothetical protein
LKEEEEEWGRRRRRRRRRRGGEPGESSRGRWSGVFGNSFQSKLEGLEASMGAHGVQDEASDVGLHHRPPPSAAATISSIELSSGNSRMMGNKNSKEPDTSWPASEEKYQLQQDGDVALGGTTLEDAYEGVEIPAWHNQITLRGLLVSFVLGTLFCIITHKLNLTVGVISSLNISAGLLGFFFIKT